jgi:uncharacterized protein (DUF934 family)
MLPPLNSQTLAASATKSPSPLRGGVRGNGQGDPRVAPPSLSLPHKGAGDGAALDGELDPDGPIWRDGAFRKDTWAIALDGEPLPETPAILTKPRWLIERVTLAGRNRPIGLKLEPGESLDDIAGDLAHFSVIALNFPKFSDGRAFSTASLLREKHAFKGELRAVGNVLSDQIPLMRRVGFDTFEVAHAPTRRALLEGRIAEVRLHYQPAVVTEPPAGTRPWLRRTSS